MAVPMFELLTGAELLERRDFPVADTTLLDPMSTNPIFEGEWLELNASKQLIRTTPNNANLSGELTNAFSGQFWGEGALVTALREGLCAGAALDVYENEPHITEGLDALPNVILTPHIGSATDVARDTMAVMAAQNLIEFFEGEEVKNKVVVS
jgi:hypothetical protein